MHGAIGIIFGSPAVVPLFMFTLYAVCYVVSLVWRGACATLCTCFPLKPNANTGERFLAHIFGVSLPAGRVESHRHRPTIGALR